MCLGLILIDQTSDGPRAMHGDTVVFYDFLLSLDLIILSINMISSLRSIHIRQLKFNFNCYAFSHFQFKLYLNVDLWLLRDNKKTKKPYLLSHIIFFLSTTNWYNNGNSLGLFYHPSFEFDQWSTLTTKIWLPIY